MKILFRAKTTKKKNNEAFNNVWVEGDLIKNKDKYYIHPHANVFKVENELAKLMVCHEVIPETIGQYTGLTDKNGKKIFEGDIVVVKYPKGDVCWVGDVQFQSGVFGAEWASVKVNKSMLGSWGQTHNLRRFDDDIIERIEVIGNIHDNPELLEVKECQ